MTCLLKECRKEFEPSRSWQKFCCSAHCDRAWYLRLRRRVRARRNTGGHNAPTGHFKRVYCRRYIIPGQIRRALELLAGERPEFFLRLAASAKLDPRPGEFFVVPGDYVLVPRQAAD